MESTHPKFVNHNNGGSGSGTKIHRFPTPGRNKNQNASMLNISFLSSSIAFIYIGKYVGRKMESGDFEQKKKRENDYEMNK